MQYSICIPNYNYERYLGRTIQSVLDQDGSDFEILVSDNASTDRSTEVVNQLADRRIKLSVNRCNIGFAGNLDRAARMASGERMILLSSDDLMRPGALATYRAIYERLGGGDGVVACSAVDVIDGDDKVIGRIGLPSNSLWREVDRAPELDEVAGGPVYKIPGPELLRRCLLKLQNPFHFAATVYPRRLYEAVEGYGGSRLMNPDKWFHWKLLGKAETALFVDRTLFAYRWHATNQAAIQAGSGALKFLIDEYTSTFELDAGVLKELGLSRTDVERAFVEQDIGRHGLATLAKGHRLQARRIYHFGKAAYPQHVRRNWKCRTLAMLLRLGPAGQRLATASYNYYSRNLTHEPNNAWQ